MHAQLIEQLMSDLGVVGETAFGHLHDEALRRQLRLSQRVHDKRNQTVLVKLAIRQVHAHGKRGDRLPPSFTGVHSMLQNPRAHRNDKTALFEQRDKLEWRQVAILVATPTRKRLGSHDATRCSFHLRLVAQAESLEAVLHAVP